MTNFWEHFSPEKELAQARHMARAAKAARRAARDLVDARGHAQVRAALGRPRCRRCMGKYKVPHFDAKGEADAVLPRAGVPTTFLLTVVLLGQLHLLRHGPEAQGPDGTLAITLPMGDKRLPGIAAEDIGKCAYGIFKRGTELIGKTVGIAGEHLTGAQMAAALSQRAGQGGRATTTCRPRCTAASASRARTTSATCSSSSATSTSTSAARAASSSRAR